MEIVHDATTGTFPVTGTADVKRERFRRERLPETLENAWKLAPYRAHWGQAPPEGDQAAYFAGLPSIEKGWVTDNLDGLLVDPSAEVENILCSTGTSGKRLFRLVTKTEVDFRDEFFGKVAGRDRGERPLMLRFGPTGHGTTLRRPGRPMTLTSSLNAPWDQGQALDFLLRDFTAPGVESRVGTLVVGPWQILQLAATLIEAGIAADSLAVHTILVLSAPVTPALRDWVKGYWPGINLVERFSLSEVFGGATYSERCGTFHTDLHVLPEFQPYRLGTGDPGSGADLGEALTELWLTELYPFSQGQPLIRYRTRDLVARRACACGRSDSFQFHGRDIGTVLTADGKRALLTSMEVTDAWYDHLLGPDMDPGTLRMAGVVPTFLAGSGDAPRASLKRVEFWSEAGPDVTKRIDGFLDWLTTTAKDRGVVLDL